MGARRTRPSATSPPPPGLWTMPPQATCTRPGGAHRPRSPTPCGSCPSRSLADGAAPQSLPGSSEAPPSALHSTMGPKSRCAPVAPRARVWPLGFCMGAVLAWGWALAVSGAPPARSVAPPVGMPRGRWSGAPCSACRGDKRTTCRSPSAHAPGVGVGVAGSGDSTRGPRGTPRRLMSRRPKVGQCRALPTSRISAAAKGPLAGRRAMPPCLTPARGGPLGVAT